MAKPKTRKRRDLTTLANEAEARLRLEKARTETAAIRLRRKAIRSGMEMLSTFGAAEKNRLSQEWPSKTVSADQAIVPDQRTLNARARQAVRDHWAGSSAVGAFRRNVVGIGITVRSAARDPVTGAEREEFNQRIDQLWDRWARDRTACDRERRKTFVEYQGLTIQEFATVGESLTVLSYEPRADQVGLVLQMIEPEMMDTGKVSNPANGNKVRGGVELDEYGAPVAYWIYTKAHPLESAGSTSERVEAERVLHLFRQTRVRQTRGVTPLAPILRKLRHLEMYDEYEIVAARMQACVGGAIQTDGSFGAEDLSLPLGAGETGQDSRGSTEVVFEPGMMVELPPGKTINWNSPTRPGGQYDPFVRSQLRQIGAGINLDYAQLARDYSEGNFSSQRQGKLECDKEFDPLVGLMVDILCRPTREQFQIYAVLEGRVEAPGMFDSPEMLASYLADEWTGPPKPWVDPAKQAVAAKIAIDYRLRTRRQLLNEFGLSYRDEFRQHADEQRLAEKLKLYLPDAQAKATATPGAPPVAPQEPRPTKAQPEENETDTDDAQSKRPAGLESAMALAAAEV